MTSLRSARSLKRVRAQKDVGTTSKGDEDLTTIGAPGIATGRVVIARFGSGDLAGSFVERDGR